MIGLDPNVLANGTRLVTTPPLDALLMMAPVAFKSGYIVALDGPAGCGKTTALTALIRQTDKLSVSISLDPRSSDKDVVKLLQAAVLGRPAPPRSLRTDMLAELRRALSGRELLVVVDEAQHAGITDLEMIRVLHMDPTASWDLVLSGADLHKRLTAEQMLKSRVMHWAIFTPLTADELPSVLAKLHPLFEQLDPDLLLRADRAGCNGVLREWVKVLGVLQELDQRGLPLGRAELEQALTAVLGSAIRITR